MSSFQEKKRAAKQKIESGALDLRENPLGEMVEEKPYHVMYSVGFPGYFLYMVLWNYGSLDDNRQYTWWGFDYYDHIEEYSPYYREPPADYEYSLSTIELVPWLDKYYGACPHVEDYQYLLNIIESGHNSTGEVYINEGLNKTHALKWLNKKIEQVAAHTISPATLGLQWNGPRTEFVELVHALLNAGVLTITEKGGRDGAIKRLGQALGIKGATPYSTVMNDIKNRNNDRQTPLLDRLKDRFFISGEE